MSGLIKGLVASRESLTASRKILALLSKDMDQTRRSLRPEPRYERMKQVVLEKVED